MENFKFLQKIDNLKLFLNEEQVLELYNEAEDILKSYEDKIEGLKEINSDKNAQIKSLKDDISYLGATVFEFESMPNFKLRKETHNNIRTITALESLFSNIDYIPVLEIENLVEKYKAI
jgi:hypothetical protein